MRAWCVQFVYFLAGKSLDRQFSPLGTIWTGSVFSCECLLAFAFFLGVCVCLQMVACQICADLIYIPTGCVTKFITQSLPVHPFVVDFRIVWAKNVPDLFRNRINVCLVCGMRSYSEFTLNCVVDRMMQTDLGKLIWIIGWFIIVSFKRLLEFMLEVW